MGIVDSTIDAMAAQLSVWKSKLDELQMNVTLAKAEQRVLQHRLDAARLKLANAGNEFQKYREAEGGAWEKHKLEIDRAWVEVEIAFLQL